METMFDVGMAAVGLRALSLRIATSIRFKMNKKLFAQGVGKMIPLVGGITSGGSALIALQQMRGRLQKEFALSVDYTSQQQEHDFKKIFNIVDIDSTDEASAETILIDSSRLSQEDFLTQQGSINQMYTTRTIIAKQRVALFLALKRINGRVIYFNVLKVKPLDLEASNTIYLSKPPLTHYKDRILRLDLSPLNLLQKT